MPHFFQRFPLKNLYLKILINFHFIDSQKNNKAVYTLNEYNVTIILKFKILKNDLQRGEFKAILLFLIPSIIQNQNFV